MRPTLVWLVAAAIASPCGADVFRVRHTGDSGDYSLRWAIEQANANPGRDKITFAARLKGSGIWPRTLLPRITDGQTIIKADIDADGAPDITLNGGRLAAGPGLCITGNRCVVSGLAIVGFPGAGIEVPEAQACTIKTCHIGVDLAGTTPKENGWGDILLDDTDACVIGGTAPGDRNVICGANTAGGGRAVALWGACDTRVLNNYIGVARDGQTALGSGGLGIDLGLGIGRTPTGNVIGGARSLGEGNVFGGLLDAIRLRSAEDNLVQGNNFGLAADGDSLLRIEEVCIAIANGSQRNTIGGTDPDLRNAFAGSAAAGVRISSALTADNEIQGNYFGLNVAGTAQRRLRSGVEMSSSAGANTIGGATASGGNYFALKWPHPGQATIRLFSGAGDGSLIQRNTFGVRPDGTLAAEFGAALYMTSVSVRFIGNTIARHGIGVYSAGAGADPRVFRNTFRDCTWAVRIDLDGSCQLGNLGNTPTGDDGGNVFQSSNTWHIYNLTPNRIRAEGNDFGTTSRSAINAKIWDKRDNDSLGRVDFSPLAGGVLPTGATLALTGLAALPTRSGGAELAFSLSAPAGVTVSILNIAGRPVATAAHERSCGAGLQRLTWSGRSDRGIAVPNGTYLVRVVARDGAGAEASGIGALSLSR
jgi:hypothetical protein